MKRAPSTRVTVLSWALVAAVALLIFCMSAKTGDALDHDSGIIGFLLETLRSAANALFGHPVDVSPVGHFAEFFLLGLALMNALRLRFALPKACVFSTIIASLYGVSDEFHQIFVPARTCDPTDWLVDTIAALLGALLFWAIFTIWQKHRDSQANHSAHSL